MAPLASQKAVATHASIKLSCREGARKESRSEHLSSHVGNQNAPAAGRQSGNGDQCKMVPRTDCARQNDQCYRQCSAAHWSSVTEHKNQDDNHNHRYQNRSHLHKFQSKTRGHQRQETAECQAYCCCCCPKCATTTKSDTKPCLANKGRSSDVERVPDLRAAAAPPTPRTKTTRSKRPTGPEITKTSSLLQQCSSAAYGGPKGLCRVTTPAVVNKGAADAANDTPDCRKCQPSKLPTTAVNVDTMDKRPQVAEPGQEGRASTSCSDSDRLRDEEAEISSATTTSSTFPDERERRLALADSAGRVSGCGGSQNRWSSSSASWSSSLLSLNDSVISGGHKLNEDDSNRRRTPSDAERQLRPLKTAQSSWAKMNNAPKRRPAPLPPNQLDSQPEQCKTRLRSQSVAHLSQAATEPSEQDGIGEPRLENRQPISKSEGLLCDQEVIRIEHFLKSHKSSIYVCGCMANLYFTKTHLADNGRASKASINEWKLNKTGVPVLIFDSGLTRNRNKRRLSISLAERGSGFVLWSDTIDHLSNYRAFSPRLHSVDGSTLR